MEKETVKQSSHPRVSPYLQMGRLPRLEAWFNIIAWSGFVAYFCYSTYWASQGSYVCHSLLSVSPASHICFFPSIHFVLLSCQPFPSPHPSLIPFLALSGPMFSHLPPHSRFSSQPFISPNPSHIQIFLPRCKFFPFSSIQSPSLSLSSPYFPFPFRIVTLKVTSG